VSTGVWEEGLSASDLSAPKVDVAKELEKSPTINSAHGEYENNMKRKKKCRLHRM
jgi:hypothetical protein